MSRPTITFRVFRFRAGDPDSTRFEEAKLPVNETTTVLDVLERLRGGDPTLMYRHSCHHGSCGAANGNPKLPRRKICPASPAWRSWVASSFSRV